MTYSAKRRDGVDEGVVAHLGYLAHKCSADALP